MDRTPGMTTPAPIDQAAEVTRLLARLRDDFAVSEWDRNTFRSDPGGYLDYVGAMLDLPDDVRDAVAVKVIATLFLENGWERP